MARTKDTFGMIEVDCIGGPCDGRSLMIRSDLSEVKFPIRWGGIATYRVARRTDGTASLRWHENTDGYLAKINPRGWCGG